MSDTLSPEAIYFRDRIAELDEEIRDRQSRRAELELAFKAFTDGRSTVNRQRRTRGNGPTPGAAEQAPLPDRHVSGGTHSDETAAGEGL